MSRLRSELSLLLIALQFLTRVPVPAWVGWSPERLNASARWFPLVGAFVGAVAGGVFEAARLIWPVPVAVLLSMVASVLLTGAFHEDGFADSCDGFGGGLQGDPGRDRPRVLAIMKDSRVGSYAVVGLVLLLGLKFQALVALPAGWFLAASVASHAASRMGVLLVMARLPYVRDDAGSKSKPMALGVTPAGLAVAGLTAVLVSAPLGWPGAALLMAVTGLSLAATGWLRRRLGGYVGDALGATQQLAEVAALLGALAVWPG